MFTLYDGFSESVRRHAGLIAVEVGGERYSYATLEALAGRLAALIEQAAGGRPRAVGLYCSRSIGAYAGYLGALRAGAVVVPLNPRFPPARTTAICRTAGVDVLLCDDSGAATGDEVAAAAGARLVRLPGRWWEESGRDCADPARPADIAYVLFTSGSTGQPKGVPIRHAQLREYLPWCIARYQVGPGSRLSQSFDLTFDPSVFDMFVTWHAGAALIVPQAEDLLTPARFVVTGRLTHWFSVPSVISVALRMRGLRPGSMPALRYSMFAGEQLTLDQARSWAAAAPQSAIDNLYGPTELTITCTGYRLPRDSARWPGTSNGTVPIGRPHPHLDAAVLTEAGQPGTEGELWVRGSQRFEGYLDPRDNAGRFARWDGAAVSPVPDAPAAGDWYRTGDYVRWQRDDLVHLGRHDQQVKINGYRIETSEVEHVLRRHSGVQDAVVVAVTDRTGRMELRSAFTGQPGIADELASHARRALPAYMVPARTTHMARLPVNANGKIDRARLAQFLAAD